MVLAKCKDHISLVVIAGTLVNLHLVHHGRELVKKLQCWKPRPIPLLPENRSARYDNQTDVILALGQHHLVVLWPDMGVKAP